VVRFDVKIMHNPFEMIFRPKALSQCQTIFRDIPFIVEVIAITNYIDDRINIIPQSNLM
jgi:hypothetical protein